MENNKSYRGAAVMYLATVGTAFAVMTGVFAFFPRSKYSELEKRDLAEFPDIAEYSGRPGQFTAAVSSWFSDTEPYRDGLMTLSMNIRGAMRGNFLPEEEAVTFRPAAPAPAGQSAMQASSEALPHHEELPDSTSAPVENIEDGNAKLGDSGTIIVGKGDKVRALMAFGGTAKGGGGYVDLMNTLAETFPSQNVYAMIAPLATEFYLPARAAKASNPQKPFIYSVRDRLNPKVKFVDVYAELSRHTAEDIYLRTDHHWAGLGGYYAAMQLAKAAGVPFHGLEDYDRHVIKNFVGSMYGYSKDIAVKNAPEDFVFYTPKNVKYEADYVAYTLDKNFNIVKESKPYKAPLFKKFKDGSSSAYLTFVGSDQVFVKVTTSTPGSRRLLIVKDSYGNAVPGNLLYSFSEVHIIDFRYFTHNLKDYVAKNGITDIAVCFNVFNAYSSGSAAKVKRMLSQKGGVHVSAPVAATESSERKVSPRSASPQTTDLTTPAETAHKEYENNDNDSRVKSDPLPETPDTEDPSPVSDPENDLSLSI